MAVDRDEFLRRIGTVNVWRRGDVRAPHKPLLLLLALGRVVRGETRLAGYGDVVEPELTALLKHFGPPRASHHPDQPFQRLPGDDLWEIPGLETPGSAPIKGRVPLGELRKMEGGFPDPVHRLLRTDPQLVEEAVRRILGGHFPTSLHADIREAVGLPAYGAPLSDAWSGSAAAAGTLLREAPVGAAGPSPSVAPRDPRFRHRVLRAYERRCAVCGFDVRVEDQLLGLEAAHIKWHAAGGPDSVPNGLALCSFHHKALDVGALGLERSGDEGVAVLVSSEISGRSSAVRQLLDFQGEPLRPPQHPDLAPSGEYVKWHRREVFRGPALST